MKTGVGACALVGFLVLPALAGELPIHRALTIEDRVAAQKAMEQVYWNHRIWPQENKTPKPPLSAVMSDDALRARVVDDLKKSNALETLWGRPITGKALQTELDRVARDSRDRKTLQELFAALGNDPLLIAETLARPLLADRLVRSWSQDDERYKSAGTEVATDDTPFTLPKFDMSPCTLDTWTQTRMGAPDARYGHLAVWTGSEMIIWGGQLPSSPMVQTGGRYDPSTDTWSTTSLGPNTAVPSYWSTAVWTGTEMIVWGGSDQNGGRLNVGARYAPASDTWTPVSTGANAPSGRWNHSAVWTGSEMIIWGGQGLVNTPLSNGGRYDPVTDTWTAVSTGPNVPTARSGHSAVWSGTEMVVWGGQASARFNSGGRYNPVTDTWQPTSTGVGVPLARSDHTGTWTGSRMIVWGGQTTTGNSPTGGRYDPVADTWQSLAAGGPTLAGANPRAVVWTGAKMIVADGIPGGAKSYDPASNSWAGINDSALAQRSGHTAVWSGSELIIWGGSTDTATNTGARYAPATGTWVPTSVAPMPPAARFDASATWTGAEMIVWGGMLNRSTYLLVNKGGRYTPATDSWSPTSTGADVPSPRIYFSAVWTGLELIIWGGSSSYSQSVVLGNGGRYDPVTDRWMPISADPTAPNGRGYHTAVWTGSEMIVWCGGGSTGYATTGSRYNPVSDSWTPMSNSANAPNCFGTVHYSFWTGREMLTGLLGNGGRYDPATDSWTAIPAAPPGLVGSYYAATWTGTDLIYWGGSGGPGYLNTGARYNPDANTWIATSTGPNVPAPRQDAKAIWTGSEMIIWGGVGATPSGLSPDTTPNSIGGGRYDPTTDSWAPLTAGSFFPQREFTATAWMGDRMIVWSGGSSSSTVATATGGLYCACPNLINFYRDADGDGFGDPAVSIPRCDGVAPAGYVVDATDCNDANGGAHPGAGETCNGLDDNCNGLVDESSSGEDVDGDSIHDVCDNCRFASNAAQSDFDHDGEGDACDVNDGLIYVRGTDDKNLIEWQVESGPASWNVYTGDLTLLRATGIYTQSPGSNPLAERHCGVIDTFIDDPDAPPEGAAKFSLVTGITGGIEGSLGTNSAGAERANTEPCP